MQIEQFFSYIMARTSYIWWYDNDVRFTLDEHAYLDLYSASSLKQQFMIDNSLHTDTFF